MGRITKVRYGALRSLEYRHDNRQIAAEAEVNEGEEPFEVFKWLRAEVDRELDAIIEQLEPPVRPAPDDDDCDEVEIPF